MRDCSGWGQEQAYYASSCLPECQRLALGARSVFLGRPFNYAAAVGGPEGVAHGISLLQQEVMRNMAMMGINQLSELTPESLLYVGRAAQ